MNVDKDGSYLREPSISEGALKSRIEALAAKIPFNKSTVLERHLTLDGNVASIGLVRAKKELEASLGHQIDNRLSVTMHYNPNWQSFDAKEITFALPGTISLTAHATYDAESDSFSSYLYDNVTEQQIARKPIQTSTIDALLHEDGGQSNIIATTHEELMAQLYQSASADMGVKIHQFTTLIDEEAADNVYGVCTVERTQTYGEDDILDVIEFVTETIQPYSSHARVISVLTSQHGSTITAEEVTHDYKSGTNSRRQVEFDYENLEKFLRHVRHAEENLAP